MSRFTILVISFIGMTSTAGAAELTAAGIRRQVSSTVEHLNREAAGRRASLVRGRGKASKEMFNKGMVAGYEHASSNLKGHTAHPGSPFARDSRVVPATQGAKVIREWEKTTRTNGWSPSKNPYLLGFEYGGRLAAYTIHIKWISKNNPTEAVPTYHEVFDMDPLRPAVVAEPKTAPRSTSPRRRNRRVTPNDDLFRDINRQNGGDI